MTLRKTPEFIRRRVPEPRMRQLMRWLFIFAIGFYLGTIAVDIQLASCVEEEDR